MASNITTLVEKAKLGDADAFSTLYQMYYPKMKGICINILREDKAVVDDLVQDAFVLAFVSAQWKFSGDKHKSLQVDTERTFHQRYPLAML